MYYRLDLAQYNNDLTQALAAIPKNATSLHLSSMDKMSKAQLVRFFSALPIRITSLNLEGNKLGYEHGNTLAQIFTAIPQSITSLELADNDLDVLSGAELAQAFAAIPNRVTSLHLTGNRLGDKIGIELVQAFTAIPDNVTFLSLRSNYLYNLEDELAQVFRAIPNSITTLDLSCNNFDDVSVDELVEAFTTIPNRVTSLNLSGNNALIKKLPQVLPALPDNVTYLDLSHNYLGHRSVEELKKLFSAIPDSVVGLNLSGNAFGVGFRRKGIELKKVFESIPDNVTTLDLRYSLLRLTPKDLVSLKGSLPHIQTVYYDASSIAHMSREQRRSLRAVFPNVKEVMLKGSSDKKNITPMDMDNYVRELGGQAEVASLLHQCFNFFNRQELSISDMNVPEEVKELSECYKQPI